MACLYSYKGRIFTEIEFFNFIDTPEEIAYVQKVLSLDMTTEESDESGDIAFLIKGQSSITKSDNYIHSTKVMAYIKRFLPDMSRQELLMLDRLQMMQLFGKEAFGAFTNGIIFLEASDKGDVYSEAIRHEVFHKIFAQYLNEDERLNLYQATREEFSMPDASKSDLEEKLAWEFQNRKDYTGLAGIIVNFFRNLKKLFNLIIGKKNIIEDLFERIERGKFTGMGRDSVFDQRVSFLSKVQKIFAGDPYVIKKAKTMVQRIFLQNGILALGKNVLPKTDSETKEHLIKELRGYEKLFLNKAELRKDLSSEQQEQINKDWSALSDNKKLEEKNNLYKGLPSSYEKVWGIEEENTLKAVQGLLKTNPDNRFYVIDEFIKEIKPDVNFGELETVYEENEEQQYTEGEHIGDHTDKDNTQDIRTKMTGHLKMFLSSIPYANNTKFVGIEQALYYIYENFYALNGYNQQSFAARIEESFESTGMASAQKRAVLAAILKMVNMSTMESSEEVSYQVDSKTFPVYLNETIGFENENSFSYKGAKIKREKNEPTTRFFDRILAEITVLDNGNTFHGNANKRGFTIDSFTPKQNRLILKSYWQRDMANRVIKDLVNLADSLYFTNPYKGEYKIENGGLKYTYYSLEPDKDKVAIDGNVKEALWQHRYAIAKILEKPESNKEQLFTEIFRTMAVYDDLDHNRMFAVIPGQEDSLTNAIRQMVALAVDSKNSEDFYSRVTNMKGVLATIKRNLSYNMQATKTINAYIRSDGKKQFFQRYTSYATKLLVEAVRPLKGKPFSKIRKPFSGLNPFVSDYDYNKLTDIKNYALDEGFNEKDKPQTAVLYDQQSASDYLTRSFLIQFVGPVSDTWKQTFDEDDLMYWQNFYTVSDKSVNVSVKVPILDQRFDLKELARSHGSINRTVGFYIVRAIQQEFERPDAGLLGLKNYKEADQQNSLLPGLTPGSEGAEIREKIRDRYKDVIGTTDAKWMKDILLDEDMQRLVDIVVENLEIQARTALDRIWDINEKALYQKDGVTRINVNKAIVWPADLENIYNKKLPLISPKYLYNDKNKSVKYEGEEEGGKTVEHKLVMEGYKPNIYDWQVEKEHIDPIWMLFYMNNYLNGLFLNQLVAGDQAMFRGAVDQVKRMSGPFAIGMSPLQTQDFKDFESAASTNPRVMNRKFRVRVLPDLYNIRRADGTIDDVLRYERDADAIIKDQGGNKINVTDAAGMMSNRRYQQTLKGFGPGLDLRPNQKPVHWEINENSGAQTYLKYATFALTDEVCAVFPKFLAQRLDMETYGLTGKDKTRAEELITKQVSTYKTGGLNSAEQLELEALFAKNEDKYIDEDIHESGVKVGVPETLSRYENDRFISDAAGRDIVELDNRNWRIQLNPKADIDSNIALFTQLLYYAGFDGYNIDKAQNIYENLGAWFDLNLNDILSKLGVKHLRELKESDGKVIVSKIKNMLIERTGKVIGKERFWEYLSEGLSLDIPAIANEVSTQLSSVFNKGVINVKFPGSKFQLLSPELSGDYQNSGRPMPRIVDGVAEVYLPNHWAKALGITDLSDPRLKELNLMLGYRIPSTGFNSGTPLKIIGFWPTTDNVVIAPAELNLRMGSDFDVDSLFVAKYEIYTEAEVKYLDSIGIKSYAAVGLDKSGKEIENFESTLNKRRAENQARKLLKKLYANRIVNSYLKLLSSPENLEDITRPTDFELIKGPGGVMDYLKEAGVNLESSYDINNIMDNMELYLANRSGQSLVGITANTTKTFAYLAAQMYLNNKAVTFEPITYGAQVYDRIGYGTTLEGENPTKSLMTADGRKLSNVFAVLVNVAVDNAKEQLLSVLNLTTANSNAFLTLVGAGLPLNSVVTIMRQPVIQDISDLRRIRDYDIRDQRLILAGKLGIDLNGYTVKEVNDEILKKYLKYTSVKQAEKELSQVELKEFYDIQLSVLDLFEKAYTVGDALFTTSQALGIIQNNRPSFAEMQDTMDHIFKIYPERVFTAPSTAGMQFEVKNYVLAENKEKKFPLNNVNLLALPHWKAAFNQLQTLYTINQKVLFRHSKLLQLISQDLDRSFDLRLDTNPNLNRALIRAEVIKAVISAINFKYNGSTVDFSNFEEPAYTDRNGNVFYGNDAFFRRFYDDVRKAKEKYRGNAFLSKLRLDYDPISKMPKIFTRDLTGILSEYEEVKIVENAFKELNSEERVDKTAYDGYWYSPLQWDFVKYLALTRGLAFGSASYSYLLPADILVPVSNALDSALEKMTQVTTDVTTTEAYRSAEEKNDTDQLSHIKSVANYNELRQHIVPILALQIALNNNAQIKQYSYRATGQEFRRSLKQDKEGNFYNFRLENTKQVSQAEDIEVEEGESIIDQPNSDLYKNAPTIIRYKDRIVQREIGVDKTVYYVMVKSGQNENGDVLYQIAGKASGFRSYQFSLNLFNKEWKNWYNIQDFFGPKNYFTQQNSIQDDILSSYQRLKPGTQVLSLKKGDDLRLFSSRYRVTEVLQEGKEDKFKQAAEEAKELVKRIERLDKLSEYYQSSFKGRLENEIRETERKLSQPGLTVSEKSKLTDRMTELTDIISQKKILEEELAVVEENKGVSLNKYRIEPVTYKEFNTETELSIDTITWSENDADNARESKTQC